MEFDQVIAPLGKDVFLSDHWEKSWLHLPGAAGRFADLLSWDDLGGILENTRMAPPHIRLSKDGQTVEPERYVHTPPGAGNLPRVDSGRLVALLAEGATLVLQSVEEIAPRIRALSHSLRDALSARNHVNLYAGWRSENGFDLHWDPHEVMVLQLHGRKRWQIFGPTQEQPLDVGSPPKPAGAPVWDGLLNWMVTKLRGEVHLRRNLPVLQDIAARQAHMAQLRAIVAQALGDGAIEDFMRDAGDHAHGRAPIRLPQPPYEQAAPLRDESRVRLASSPRLLLKIEADKVSFNAYGKNYSVPLYVKPALELLRDDRAIPLAELCAAVNGDVAVVNLKRGLAMLASAGVVLVEVCCSVNTVRFPASIQAEGAGARACYLLFV